METEDLKLQDIQAGNQAARKKLEGFRSGLQRLMNKKSKKLSHHEPPSHDTKSPLNKKQTQYFSSNSANSASSNYNTNQPVPGAQFGFNSTLFRQIADDTVMVSNPSGLHKEQTTSKHAYNSVPNTEYFSVSSKPQTNFYEARMQIGGNESFSKASKLFSEVQDIINKSKKSAKLPVKPIQKYFDKIEQNLSVSNVEKLELSRSGLRFEELTLSPRKEQNPMKEGKKEIRDDKIRGISGKDEVKSASEFLRNYKGKGESMKTPPLPPSFYREQRSKKSIQNHPKEQNNKKGNSEQQEDEQSWMKTGSKSPSKIAPGQNSVQIHKNKLKEALHERKKIMKEDGILDDSIELELSDEENESVQSEDKEKNLKEIRRLEQQKQQLLQELTLIEEELDRLQNH